MDAHKNLEGLQCKLSPNGQTIRELARTHNIPYARLASRLRYGWSLSRALFEPKH